MERFTRRNEDNTGYYYPYCLQEDTCSGEGCKMDMCEFPEKVCDRLGEYEDTGLTPGEIEELKETMQVVGDKHTTAVSLSVIERIIDTHPKIHDMAENVERLSKELKLVEERLVSLLEERECLRGQKLVYQTAIDIVLAGGKE